MQPLKVSRTMQELLVQLAAMKIYQRQKATNTPKDFPSPNIVITLALSSLAVTYFKQIGLKERYRATANPSTNLPAHIVTGWCIIFKAKPTQSIAHIIKMEYFLLKQFTNTWLNAAPNTPPTGINPIKRELAADCDSVIPQISIICGILMIEQEVSAQPKFTEDREMMIPIMMLILLLLYLVRVGPVLSQSKF